MRRRTLLSLGFGSAAVLAFAGLGASAWRPGLQDRQLTAAGRAVFEAVAQAVLDGSLPEDEPARGRALAAHLDRLAAAVAAFPPALQSELSQLLAVLSTAAGRRALTGLPRDWPQAGIAEVQSALESMRQSSLALRQQTYHALRDLTNAAFYADPQTWRLLAYPGPVPV